MRGYQVFIQILEMGLMVSFVILFVLLVRGVFMRHFPKKYVYILWLVVGVRLVCPAAVSSPVSLFNLHLLSLSQGRIASLEAEGKNKTSDFAASRKKQDGNIQNSVQQKKGQESSEQKIEFMQNQDKEKQADNKDTGNNQISAAHVLGTESHTTQTTLERSVGILFIIWILGMALLLFWNLYLTIRIKRRLQRAVLYQQNIFECEEIASPFVMGVVRPCIYIPFRLSGEEREYILKHEQYHIHRKDYLVKFAAFLITTVYWFHPLVWVSYFCMIRDMEMSCDEHVLTIMGEDIRRDYSRLLLAFATNQRQLAVNLLTFGETDTRKRVKNIMKYKKKGKWTGAAALLLIVIVSIVCLTNGRAEGKLKEVQNEDTQGKDIERDYQYPTGTYEYENMEGEVITESTVNGYQVKLIAKDVELIEEITSPYNNMYEGEFVLETIKDGAKCDEMPLIFDSDKILDFPQSITLHIKDYNGDGKKNDFTLGQRAGSSNMIYNIYTVDENGYISQYEFSSIGQSYFTAQTGEYSQEFEQKDGGLYYMVYNVEESKVEEQEINVVSVKSVREQALSSKDTPEHRIMAGLEEIMPRLLMDEVYQGDWRKQYNTDKKVYYSIANKRRYDDVTMRLDFCYQDNKLVQYVSKNYGFVLAMPEDRIDKKQALKLVQKFAKIFLGQNFTASDLKQKALLGRYEGAEDYYAYFKDTQGGEYLVDIKHNVLEHYYAAEELV